MKRKCYVITLWNAFDLEKPRQAKKLDNPYSYLVFKCLSEMSLVASRELSLSPYKIITEVRNNWIRVMICACM